MWSLTELADARYFYEVRLDAIDKGPRMPKAALNVRSTFLEWKGGRAAW